MTAFRYQAVDAGGRPSNGVIEATSQAQAREALRARALLPVSLSEAGAGPKAGAKWRAPHIRKPVSGKMLAQITRQLATLLENDIRLEDALNTIGRQTSRAAARAVVLDLRRRVVEGHAFSEALSAHKDVFPEHYRASVAAGERAGRLDTVLAHLAEFTEGRQANQQTVRLALLYPVFLALVSGAIIALLLTNVVPDIVKVYRRREEDLPMLTEALIAVSEFLANLGVWLLAGALLGLVGMAWVTKRPDIALKIDRRFMALPAFGTFAARRHAAQFSATLSMLVQSGVPLVDAMRIAAQVLSNRFVRQQLLAAATDVSEGAALDRALAKAGCLPPMFVAMVSGAARSGELGPILARSAATQQRELDASVKAVVALVEPVVLLVMGGIVLLVVMAILSPIVNLNRISGL